MVAHLTGMSTARRIERELEGDVTPSEDMASPGTVNEDAFRDGRAQRALALRNVTFRGDTATAVLVICGRLP